MKTITEEKLLTPIEGSYNVCFHRKMMPRISSRPESVRDRKAEGISRKNGRAARKSSWRREHLH